MKLGSEVCVILIQNQGNLLTFESCVGEQGRHEHTYVLGEG